MDLVTELEDNKKAVYNLYSINEEDIKGLFSKIILKSETSLASHLLSKLQGYNNNTILFIQSLDYKIQSTLYQYYKLHKETYHDFFVWHNYNYNNGKCIDNYCNHETLLDDYYSKSLVEKNEIVDKYCKHHLNKKLQSIFY
jgi:hypothetical protein